MLVLLWHRSLRIFLNFNVFIHAAICFDGQTRRDQTESNQQLDGVNGRWVECTDQRWKHSRSLVKKGSHLQAESTSRNWCFVAHLYWRWTPQSTHTHAQSSVCCSSEQTSKKTEPLNLLTYLSVRGALVADKSRESLNF